VIRTPAFWRHDAWPARLLTPLSAIYGAAAAARCRRACPTAAPLPVLCVGNLTAGGTGKTPVTIALARRLQARGRTPHLLTRGYGGRIHGPHAVDPAQDDARTVGDEALLLADAAPTWVARDRLAGAMAARAGGADIAILDDGYQNCRIAKTASLVVVDGGYGFGNGRLLPAGPLRESVDSGLTRADAVVLVGEDRVKLAPRLRRHCPLIQADLAPGEGRKSIAGKPVVAFAGIGRPEKFFETLTELSCTLLGTHAFGDHHRFREQEVRTLADKAARLGAVLVTTAKDAVRLPASVRDLPRVLEVNLEWRSGCEILDAIFDRCVSDACR